MNTNEVYDALVLGSGEAGKYIAWYLASRGERVAVIERRYIGGSCPNIACLPSKNIVHSAKIAHYVHNAEAYGVNVENWQVSMHGVRARKQKMVDGLIEMHLANFEKNHAELILGEGRFTGKHVLEVALNEGGKRTLEAAKIFISTGSRSIVDTVPGAETVTPLTHIELLELDELPAHLLVVGGGYIGLEFAQAFRRLGSKVSVIERNDRLLHREDEDVSDGLAALFSDEGINVLTNASVQEMTSETGSRVVLRLDRNGVEESLEGTHLFYATGRKPNTEEIGLDVAGVMTDERGYIRVDDSLQTTAESIWAVGDCAGSPHFTHVAFDDFRIIRKHLAGRERSTKGRLIPSCMFTDPEVAILGLTETEAKKDRIPYRLFKIPMASVLKTRALSEPRGFLKALVSDTDDSILGFTGFGAGAGESMASVQLAMAAGLPYTMLSDLMIAHLTFSEGLNVLFSSAATKHSA